MKLNSEFLYICTLIIIIIIYASNTTDTFSSCFRLDYSRTSCIPPTPGQDNCTKLEYLLCNDSMAKLEFLMNLTVDQRNSLSNLATHIRVQSTPHYRFNSDPIYNNYIHRSSDNNDELIKKQSDKSNYDTNYVNVETVTLDCPLHIKYQPPSTTRPHDVELFKVYHHDIIDDPPSMSVISKEDGKMVFYLGDKDAGTGEDDPATVMSYIPG